MLWVFGGILVLSGVLVWLCPDMAEREMAHNTYGKCCCHCKGNMDDVQ